MKNPLNKKSNALDAKGPFSQVINNFGLTKFGGKKDKDFDGVSNSQDCQPKNTMRQDKVLWPQRLREQNIRFGPDVKPRNRRILQKQFRKNPQWLGYKYKNANVTLYDVHESENKEKEYGLKSDIQKASVSDDIFTNYRHNIKQDSGKIESTGYDVELRSSHFKQPVPDDVIESYESATGKSVNKQNLSEEERKNLIQYAKNIEDTEDRKFFDERYSIPTSLGHEMTHIKQSEENVGSRNFLKFTEEQFDKDTQRYEDEADLDSLKSFMSRKDKSPLSDEQKQTAMQALDSAPIHKQQQWQEMSDTEKQSVRENQPDTDNDNVPDAYDCDPYDADEQDFTPFNRPEKAERMTAAQRFGGRNLRGLKKIGSGRDRDVYALDEDKVLKVAKNPGGISQNVRESEPEHWDLGTYYEIGKDYAVVKRYKPLSKENKRKIRNIKEESQEKGPATPQTVAQSQTFSESEELQPLINYDFIPNELFAPRQWGEDEEGNLQLSDAGALMSSSEIGKYRVKDYSSDEPELRDWEESKRERKQFREKGTYDAEEKRIKQDMRYRNFEEAPSQFDTQLAYKPVYTEDSENTEQIETDDVSENQIAPQVVWHASDVPPSQRIQQEGKVYGFSSPEYALGWKDFYGKQNIYKAVADEYDMDARTFARPVPGKKRTLSDTEFIVTNVSEEQPIDEELLRSDINEKE